MLAAQLGYWRERLAGAPDFLPLPADRPRPAVAGSRGTSVRVSLPPALLSALGGVARRQGDTLFMVLLAGLDLLLARHTGQADLLVGTPIANRTHPEIEGLIGFFVNNLVLRADLSGLGEEASFADLLRQVRATTFGAYAHQDLPFERLVEELHPSRDLSHAPLFQVTFALQNAPRERLELPGLTFEAVELPARTALVDLTLEAAEDPSGLLLDWRFASDLFDAPTILRLAGHYATLLGAIADLADRCRRARPAARRAAAPDRRRDPPDRRGVERRHPGAPESLIAGDPPRSFPSPRPARPGGPGRPSGGPPGEERLTYGELDQRSSRLAHRLAALGVGAEVRVAICLPRSIHRIVAALAVLKAGGAYVPLDPTYPAGRLAFMLEDCGAPVLVVSPATAGLLPSRPGVTFVDAESESLPGAEAGPAGPDRPEHPELTVDPGTTAYVIYTSGSTGQPKGVAVEHRGPAASALHGVELLGARPGARLLQFSSFSFDTSVLEIFAALSGGAALHLGRRDSLLTGPDLAVQLREERITAAILSPAVLPTLPLGEDRFPDLSFLMSGGDRCPVEEMERWSADRRFINAYGPTEASVFVAAKVVEPGAPAPGVASIGRPIPGVRLHVVDLNDRGGRPVPIGVAGELWMGGPGLARGYTGLPEKTAASFLPDPFSDLPGERLYRSGDLARWLPGGEIEILGRIDQQVKLRGFRIELGEIEAALAEHPAVAQAAVLLRRGPVGPRLVAWMVPGPGEGGEDLAAELRAWLKARLPDPMVPAAFVRLAALPLTANGKLDRAALPEPETSRREPGDSWVAPRSALEREIAAVWQEVLGVERVGAEDNFFDLGGHSLLLVDAQARLASRLGREVPLLELFRHPNVAALARSPPCRPDGRRGGGAGASPAGGTGGSRRLGGARGGDPRHGRPLPGRPRSRSLLGEPAPGGRVDLVLLSRGGRRRRGRSGAARRSPLRAGRRGA